MKLLDKELKTFLDNVLTVDPEKEIPYDLSVPERKPEEPGPGADGVENSSQDELCVSDLVLECKPKYLKDHLPIFAPAAEIIRMEQVFKERPELKNAERSESECKGGCDGCESDPGCTGKEEQEKKD